METAKFYGKPTIELTSNDAYKYMEMMFDTKKVLLKPLLEFDNTCDKAKTYRFPISMHHFFDPRHPENNNNNLFLGTENGLKDPNNIYYDSIGFKKFTKVNEYPNQEVISITTSGGNGLIISRDSELLTVDRYGRLIKSKPYVGMSIPCHFSNDFGMDSMMFKYGKHQYFYNLKLASLLMGVVIDSESYNTIKKYIDLETEERVTLLKSAIKVNYIDHKDYIEFEDTKVLIKHKVLQDILEEVNYSIHIPAWIYSGKRYIESFLLGWGAWTKNFTIEAFDSSYPLVRWKHKIKYTSEHIPILDSLSYMFMLNDVFSRVEIGPYDNTLYANITFGKRDITSPNIPISRFEEMIKGLKFKLENKDYKRYLRMVEKAKDNKHKSLTISRRDIENILSGVYTDSLYEPYENRMKTFWGRWLFLNDYTNWTTIEKIEDLPYKLTCYSLSSKKGYHVITHNGFVI